MRKIVTLINLLITATLLLSACGSKPTPTAYPAPPSVAPVGMANPASVFCEEKGGKVEIRTDAQGGQYGVCIFPDGSECDEWAYYRSECQPGAKPTEPAPDIAPRYTNEKYGFTLNPPNYWNIEDHAQENYVIFRKGAYFLFVGYKWADEDLPPFRTGMPAGDFVDGGTFTLAGQSFPKKLLVLENKTKVVEYGGNLPVGNLRLFMWLDGDDANYAALNIPAEIMAEAEQIIASFASIPG